MLDNLTGHQLVLASNSPRRKDILTHMGFDFEVQGFDIDENYPDIIPAREVAEFIALKKAKAAVIFKNNELYITADTTVVLNNKILGKPSDAKNAATMLRLLSGNQHEVITGVCLKSKSKIVSFAVSTKVHFNTLSDSQIAYYIEHFSPLDKAGSYGIQEWIGMVGIKKIEGDYFNVVGLPAARLYRELMDY